MRRISYLTACLFIVTILFYGCGAQKAKVSSETVSTATQSSNSQVPGQKAGVEEAPVSAATAAANKTNTISRVDGMEQNYIAKPVNMSKDDWLTALAGGRKNTIEVNIGQLIHNGNAENAETFIELKGKGSKVTLVANGQSFEYYKDTQSIREKTINFLTGKKLEGTEVVKDYSKGNETIMLIIDYNENGVSAPPILFCPQKDNENSPKVNYYKLEVKN